ncbi:MAG: transcription antitermination factor NusB [Betaproteobacteria bacterium]|nr:MAG: transcription antitermination factor NusB [Betaproteobacteria bacterium]
MALRTPRRRAREVALQALYAWQVAGGDAMAEARALEGWERCDQELAAALVRGVVAGAAGLEQRITPFIDRKFSALSPVERTILCIGTYELAERRETPFRVVLNEAIELGKSYGGTDGHKYINGVLEKLAGVLRGEEFARARKTA